VPVTQFPYDATLTGSDLSALLLGTNLGTAVELKIHRDVVLAWDVVAGPATSRQGREGDACWEVASTEHTVVWSAEITETVTKTSRPAPVVNEVGGAIGDVGKVIAGIGGALLTWSGIAALSPAFPAAPIGAAGGGIITGVGGVVTGVGEGLEWLTDPKVESWTTTYQESGRKSFTVDVYTRIECDPSRDYPPIQVPDPLPTYELLLSQCVAAIGAGLASSGLLHPPR
jgi:hypothetical protein